ncbi:LOW QUALITY PROTEIN: hypothetical protein YC2023_059337 [Brassica napus]
MVELTTIAMFFSRTLAAAAAIKNYTFYHRKCIADNTKLLFQSLRQTAITKFEAKKYQRSTASHFSVSSTVLAIKFTFITVRFVPIDFKYFEEVHAVCRLYGGRKLMSASTPPFGMP